MKNLATLVALALMFVAADIGLNITFISKRDEIAAYQEASYAQETAHIEVLEKEVRLLKTDVQLLQHGYEE